MPNQVRDEFDPAESAYFAAYTGTVPKTEKSSFAAFLRDEIAASQQEVN